MSRSDCAELLPFRSNALDTFSIDAAPVGCGAFSNVVKAVDQTGCAWALKLIHLPAEQAAVTVALARQEVYVHSLLSHEPSIITLHAAFRTTVSDRQSGSSMDMIVLQMPLIQCNLMTYISHGCETIWGDTCQKNCFPSATIESIFLQMVNAVRKCHEAGITHADLKLENFLLGSDGSVCLCDFGLASFVDPARRPCMLAAAGKQGGTSWTMSPGRLQGQDEGAAGDWWSVGVLLYQLLNHGAWPWKSEWKDSERCDAATVQVSIRKAVTAGRLHRTASISTEALALLSGLLVADPTQRGSLPLILQSGFLQDNDFVAVGAALPQLRDDMLQLLQRRRDLRSREPLGEATFMQQQRQQRNAGPPPRQQQQQHGVPAVVKGQKSLPDVARSQTSDQRDELHVRGWMNSEQPHMTPLLCQPPQGIQDHPQQSPRADAGGRRPCSWRGPRRRSLMHAVRAVMCMGCLDSRDQEYQPL